MADRAADRSRRSWRRRLAGREGNSGRREVRSAPRALIVGGQGYGLSVRVTFVRGPRCVVVGVDPSIFGGVYGLVHAVRVGVDVSVVGPLDVPDEDEVVDDGPLMSVVTGGLVLVIVAVVVGADDE